MQKECLGKYKGETPREYEGNDEKNNMLWLQKETATIKWRLQNEDSYMYVLKVVIPLLRVLLLVRVRL